MTLVGFRVRTDGAEYVDDFVIYFDNLKYMSNSLSFIYDGYELHDADFSDAESGSSVSSKSTSEAK
ncbi:MAG: flagellar filament outer layer protein FlaA [Treponema porcinum]|nr:flagellar filament outer layer protein FlaA [Treponema porcinum]MDY5049512.1 flagellar filament outer layer protein FlaA [Treponema porcinum]